MADDDLRGIKTMLFTASETIIKHATRLEYDITKQHAALFQI
jgi:hypothetical protein